MRSDELHASGPDLFICLAKATRAAVSARVECRSHGRTALHLHPVCIQSKSKTPGARPGAAHLKKNLDALLIHVSCHAGERFVQRTAEALHGGNGGNCDEGSNEAILNRRCAFVVLQHFEKVLHQ